MKHSIWYNKDYQDMYAKSFNIYKKSFDQFLEYAKEFETDSGMNKHIEDDISARPVYKDTNINIIYKNTQTEIPICILDMGCQDLGLIFSNLIESNQLSQEDFSRILPLLPEGNTQEDNMQLISQILNGDKIGYVNP